MIPKQRTHHRNIFTSYRCGNSLPYFCLSTTIFPFLFLFLLFITFSTEVVLPANVVIRSESRTVPQWLNGLEGCVLNLCRSVRKQRPVCGSDGQTYPSICHLRATNKCHTGANVQEYKPVQKISKKPCPGETKCEAERRTALFERSIYSSTELYIPACSPHDGSFQPVQCHNATGYCWCVTALGRPLIGSSALLSAANLVCPKSEEEKTTHYVATSARAGLIPARTSTGPTRVGNDPTHLGSNPAHTVSSPSSYSEASAIIGRMDFSSRKKKEATKPGAEKSKRRRATQKICNKIDRALFAFRLLHLLEKEYSRANKQAHLSSTSQQSKNAKIAGWKFAELDTDGDGKLKKKELRNLRKMSIKLVKPRPCAQSFQVYCDINNDKRIDLSEWTDCLTNHSSEDLQQASNDIMLDHNSSPIGQSPTDGRGQRNRGRPGVVPPSILRPIGKPGGKDKSDKSENSKLGYGFDQTEHSKLGHRRTDGKIKEEGKDKFLADEKKTDGKLGDKSDRSSPGNSEDSETFLTLVKKDHDATSEDRTAHRPVGLVPSPARGRLRPAPGTLEGSSKRQNCLEERRKALEQDRTSPRSGVFVPECETDGKFRRAQCHNSTGRYCWCVDVYTGIPIPGISSRHELPDCSQAKHREFTGCPAGAKKTFLTGLLDRITQQMVEHINNDSATAAASAASRSGDRMPEPDPEQSIEERAVRWKLARLDTNGNQVLDKKEQREFRQQLRRWWDSGAESTDGGDADGGRGDSGKKCRRNFLKYCDENEDGNITINEWIECTGLNDKQNNLSETPGGRKGSNPFSSLLKSN